jgi:flagellar motor component MotA
LAIEDEIDFDKVNQRDILEYGLKLTIDGTDGSIIRDLLENIIKQEEDKFTRLLLEIKKAAVLSIQAGENSRITVYKLNSLTDMDLTVDPILQKYMDIKGDTGTFSEDELDTLIRRK